MSLDARGGGTIGATVDEDFISITATNTSLSTISIDLIDSDNKADVVRFAADSHDLIGPTHVRIIGFDGYDAAWLNADSLQITALDTLVDTALPLKYRLIQQLS